MIRWADKLLLRLRSVFRRRRIDHELDDELLFHLNQQIEENLAAGLTPAEARYASRRSTAVWRRSRRNVGICAE